MNVISWQNGDSTITDLPDCADPMLARVVQGVNDSHCTHRTGDLLCPPCSVEVLALADRTVGTNLSAYGWDMDRRHRLWVLLAVEEAEAVAHLVPDSARNAAEKAVAAARGWLAGTVSMQKCRAAADAASAADAAYAAAYAAADAAYAAYAAASRMNRAHALIDRFEAHAGIHFQRTLPVARDEALLAMVGQ